jgi:hypothetical protein
METHAKSGVTVVAQRRSFAAGRPGPAELEELVFN